MFIPERPDFLFQIFNEDLSLDGLVVPLDTPDARGLMFVGMKRIAEYNLYICGDE